MHGASPCGRRVRVHAVAVEAGHLVVDERVEHLNGLRRIGGQSLVGQQLLVPLGGVSTILRDALPDALEEDTVR